MNEERLEYCHKFAIVLFEYFTCYVLYDLPDDFVRPPALKTKNAKCHK